MSNEAKLYWLTRLDSIHITFGILFFISLVVLVAFHIIMYMECYSATAITNFKEKFKILTRTAWTVVIISTLVGCFLPSRNEAIIIIAGGKVLTFTEKDSSLNKLPSQTTEIISKLIEEELKKLPKDKQ